MPTIRRILKHIAVEQARGTRRCRRDRNHRIAAGEHCLSIQDDGSPFSKSYCARCALPILKQCAADLRTIRDGLYGGPVVAEHETDEGSLGTTLVEANRKRAAAG